MDCGNLIALLSDFPTLRNLFSELNDVIHFATSQMSICSNNNWSWNAHGYFDWVLLECVTLYEVYRFAGFLARVWAWICSQHEYIHTAEAKSRSLQLFMLLKTFKSEHKKTWQVSLSVLFCTSCFHVAFIHVPIFKSSHLLCCFREEKIWWHFRLGSNS